MKFEKWNNNWVFWNDKAPEKREKVWLPHDAMRTERRLKNIKNGVATGFYPGGKYHYEKEFYGEPSFAGKKVFLEFEGIYMKSSVYLNGEYVGGRIYGYSVFFVDLTGKIRIGEINLLEVVADNTQTPNSRWYSGSGIYRDVYLLTGEKEYLTPNETRIVTVSLDPAVVHLEIGVELEKTIFEQKEVTAAGHIRDLKAYQVEVTFFKENVAQVQKYFPLRVKGQEKVKTVVTSTYLAEGEITVEDAVLWSEYHPALYDVQIRLLYRKEEVDRSRQRIGIRLLEWDAERGMRVNGEEIKLRGGCVHHDHGPLGAVSLPAAERRRAERLKNCGFNALRYAHNPAGNAFLDACDEMGLYVMVEAFDQWKGKQSDYDYGMYFEKEWEKDLTSMIQTAVNHPCVVIYSYGNEISDIGHSEGVFLNKMLVKKCHELDDSRPALNAVNPVVAAMGSISKSKTTPEDIVDPYEEAEGSQAAGSLLANMIVTVAPIMSKIMGKPKRMEKNLKACFDEMDIVGYNYAEQCYQPHHEWNPERLMAGTETYPPVLAKNWPYIEKSPWVIGDFMWTAWDYLGEAGIGVPVYGKSKGGFNRPYPCVLAGCGAIDLTGEAQTPARYASIVWGQYSGPYVAVRPLNHSGEKCFFGMWRGTDAIASWSWEGMEGKSAQIEVYSTGSETELFLNDVFLGRKMLREKRAFFETPYHPGKLRAVSYDENGQILGERILQSAGADTCLTLLAEKNVMFADGEDLVYVVVEVTDRYGNRKMLSDRRIHVEVSGAAYLAGIGSAEPYTTDSFCGTEYNTYYGRMIAIARSNGKEGNVTVRAVCEELGERKIVISAVSKN